MRHQDWNARNQDSVHDNGKLIRIIVNAHDIEEENVYREETYQNCHRNPVSGFLVFPDNLTDLGMSSPKKIQMKITILINSFESEKQFNH